MSIKAGDIVIITNVGCNYNSNLLKPEPREEFGHCSDSVFEGDTFKVLKTGNHPSNLSYTLYTGIIRGKEVCFDNKGVEFYKKGNQDIKINYSINKLSNSH